MAAFPQPPHEPGKETALECRQRHTDTVHMRARAYELAAGRSGALALDDPDYEDAMKETAETRGALMDAIRAMNAAEALGWKEMKKLRKP